MTDSIEANVETADISVQEGTQQLAQASKYQVQLAKYYTINTETQIYGGCVKNC